jgi:probable FeS assembly SUF system protein SufT
VPHSNITRTLPAIRLRRPLVLPSPPNDAKPMRSHENEAFVLSRNTPAVMVPSGDQIELKAGLSGFITQALGGSFTLYVEGNLYRLAGENADAIGKQVLQPPELPPGATDDDIKALAWKQMRTCYDPEIPIDIVELGLVYECEVSANEQGGRNVAVKMTLTAPGCGMGEVLVQDVREKIEIIPTVAQANVELVFDPPWNQSMMSEAARLQTGMM